VIGLTANTTTTHRRRLRSALRDPR
jgi:hypothetical protein